MTCSAPSVNSPDKAVSELSQAKDSRETTRELANAARPRKGDPRFGPLCECGLSKAKQAAKCQACHGRARGYGLVPRDEQMRRAGRKYRGYTIVVGDENAALVDRADRLSAARAAQYDRELGALIAEQAHDERFATFARDRWVLSLDDVDRHGRPLYELIAA